MNRPFLSHSTRPETAARPRRSNRSSRSNRFPSKHRTGASFQSFKDIGGSKFKGLPESIGGFKSMWERWSMRQQATE
jgi:hypothetical protein